MSEMSETGEMHVREKSESVAPWEDGKLVEETTAHPRWEP